MIKLISKSLKIFFFILAVWPNFGFGITETTTGGNVFADITPNNPGPQTDVTIELESFSIDLDSSKISWFLNDKLSLERVGAENFSFKTGDVGKESKIIINITGNNGEFIEKTITINPAEVDIIWEAQTYVPPFYKGKALPVPGSPILFVAMPKFIDNSISLKAENIIYSWQSRSKVLSKGQGQKTILIETPISPEKISLIASTKNKNITSQTSKEISPFEGSLLIYEKKPLEKQRFEKSISDILNIASQETTLIAEPLFFNLNNIKNIKYTWTIGNKQTIENKKELTLRKDNGSSGEINIMISADSTTNSFPSALKLLKVKFGRINF